MRHQIELGKQSLDGAAGGVTKGLMMEALHVSGDILEGCDQWQTKRAADARADLELRMLDQAEVEAAQIGRGGSRGDGTVSSSIACRLCGANGSGGSGSSICIIIHARTVSSERIDNGGKQVSEKTSLLTMLGDWLC